MIHGVYTQTTLMIKISVFTFTMVRDLLDRIVGGRSGGEISSPLVEI